jgi:hypothetical protein
MIFNAFGSNSCIGNLKVRVTLLYRNKNTSRKSGERHCSAHQGLLALNNVIIVDDNWLAEISEKTQQSYSLKISIVRLHMNHTNDRAQDVLT